MEQVREDKDTADEERAARQEHERLVDSIASWVVEHKLEAPAIALLEMNKPFSFIESQLLFFFAPLIGAFGEMERASVFGGFLEDRGNIEALVKRIEERSRETGNE